MPAYPTMREYTKATPDYAYFGERNDWRLVGGTHRDDDLIGRTWWEVKQRIIRQGLAQLLPDADPDEYCIIESDSHWLVGHSERLMVSSEIPSAIIDALEAFDKACEDYALPSSEAFGYIDAEEIFSGFEYQDAIETTIDALRFGSLRLDATEAEQAAPFVISAHEDRHCGEMPRDSWPSKDAQFWGYVAYRRWLKTHPAEAAVR